MTKGIIKQSIDNIATATDSGEVPDFSNPVNNFRYFGIIGAILFIVTFRSYSSKYNLFMIRGL